MLRAESTDRAARSVSHQMNAAKFPVHRDLAGFDFEVSPVDRSNLQWIKWFGQILRLDQVQGREACGAGK